MDIYALRRTRLALMVESYSKGNIAAFAKRYGYSRAQISQFLSEAYNGGRSIGERAARTLEKRCETPPGYLDMPLSDGEQKLLDRPFSTAELRVIVGSPRASDSDPLATNETVARPYIQGTLSPSKDGFIEVWEPVNPGNIKYLGVFVESDSYVALRIATSALRPRFKNGEYILAGSKRQPQPGDDVIVQFKDERVALRQLLYIRDNEIALGSVIDATPSIVVPMDEIDFISVIVGTLHSDTSTYDERV